MWSISQLGLAAVGLAGAMRVLPTAVATPWGGVLIDRYPRGRVLAAMHALCGLQLVAVGVAVALHLSLPVLCGLVALGAVLSALVRPVTRALVPQLVDRPDELAGANAVASTMDAGAMLVGPGARWRGLRRPRGDGPQQGGVGPARARAVGPGAPGQRRRGDWPGQREPSCPCRAVGRGSGVYRSQGSSTPRAGSSSRTPRLWRLWPDGPSTRPDAP
jgi:hypothetical protein